MKAWFTFIGSAVSAAVLSTSVMAEEVNNQPFSYIGVAAGQMTYQESGTLQSGIKFITNPTTTNIFNYSGGYTAIGEKGGFYINNVTTLYSTFENEKWRASGSGGGYSVDGVYQSNEVSATHNALDVLFSYLVGSGHQVVGGIGYSRSLMDRNSFKSGTATDDFNNVNQSFNVGKGTDVVGSGAEDNNPANGSLDLAELIDAYGLSYTDGAIVNYTETFTTFSAQVGYRYDTRFAHKGTGPRWQVGATLSVPLLYDVVNTSRPTISFTSSLDGYDASAYAGYGWRFSENVGVLAKVNYFYRIRGEIKESLGYNAEIGRNVHASIPENILEYWNVGVNGYWNF